MIKQLEQVGRYEAYASEIGSMLDVKQEAYGDSFGRSHRIFEELLREYKHDENYVIPKEMLPHLLTLTRMVDKLFRVVSNPKHDRMGESPYRDIAGYALLAAAREEDR